MDHIHDEKAPVCNIILHVAMLRLGIEADLPLYLNLVKIMFHCSRDPFLSAKALDFCLKTSETHDCLAQHFLVTLLEDYAKGNGKHFKYIRQILGLKLASYDPLSKEWQLLFSHTIE